MAQKRRSKRKKEKKAPKQTIPRAERKRRAEAKLTKYHNLIADHMKDSISKFTDFEKHTLRTEPWVKDADSFVAGLIKLYPQEAELIRKAAREVATKLKELLDKQFAETGK